MNVEIRLYSTYDMDLIALMAAGYPVSTMMRDVVVAYSNGKPIHYLIDKEVDADFNILKSVHTRFSIPNNETNACFLLKNIKYRSRNMFCKALLRDALIQQNLTVFFATDVRDKLLPLSAASLYNREVKAFANVIPISSLKDTEVNTQMKIPDVVPSFIPVTAPMPVASFGDADTVQKVATSKAVQEDIPRRAETMAAPTVQNMQPESEKKDNDDLTRLNETTFDALDKLMGNDFE
ncbi:MAG: hypothetical protein K6G10_07000 [Butyrivibrio sp.]|nr:hypothetical protein [Butyrivibrio sp.]